MARHDKQQATWVQVAKLTELSLDTNRALRIWCILNFLVDICVAKRVAHTHQLFFF